MLATATTSESGGPDNNGPGDVSNVLDDEGDGHGMLHLLLLVLDDPSIEPVHLHLTPLQKLSLHNEKGQEDDIRNIKECQTRNTIAFVPSRTDGER